MAEFISIENLYKLYLNADQLICTDTRKLINGSLFFALKGANFNANEFAHKAIEAGCALAIIDDEKYSFEKSVLVPNVLIALQQLAACHRKHLSIPVLGITGSNGKTTNKELINAVLSRKYNTLSTVGNLINNKHW